MNLFPNLLSWLPLASVFILFGWSRETSLDGYRLIFSLLGAADTYFWANPGVLLALSDGSLHSLGIETYL